MTKRCNTSSMGNEVEGALIEDWGGLGGVAKCSLQHEKECLCKMVWAPFWHIETDGQASKVKHALEGKRLALHALIMNGE